MNFFYWAPQIPGGGRRRTPGCAGGAAAVIQNAIFMKQRREIK